MENTMVSKLVSSASPIVLGTLTAVAPFTFAPVCPHGHGMPMACHYCAKASLGIGIVIALLGIVSFFGSPQMRAGLNIAVASLGALEFFIVTVLIGVCPSPMMQCNMMTKPALTVLSILTVIMAGVSVLLNLRSKEGANSGANLKTTATVG